jgi:hypothetical protein
VSKKSDNCVSNIVSNQLTSLINLSIDTGVFPDSLKKAQVTPLHKKNDPLSKTNYRPVSVLPVYIHMIFNFHNTRVSNGPIYNVFPNFICNCREESIKLFRNFTCIIYNFIDFIQNYILILRVTFLEKNGLTVFQKLTFLAPHLSLCIPVFIPH